MLRYAVVLVLALIAACSTREEEWEVACHDHGFTPGADGFAKCVQQQTKAEHSM